MNPVKINVGNTTSRKLAINAMCASCVGCTVNDVEPGWMAEIKHCSTPQCPLFLFRPYHLPPGETSRYSKPTSTNP